MRPLELTLKGFQSYAEEQTFDFRERRLLGIVGPIGAGKSSLLDGIAFALYGRTPRAGKSTKGLINQRQGSAHVELWFEVEGEIWRAVRALRRKGQSAHNLYHHAKDDPEAERLEEVTGEKQATARVTELLGLDFEGFNRSVFLAQNRFADFLQATASQRDVVLKGVFGFDRLDRMEEVAKARRDGLRAELADLERLRGEVEADRVALVEAKGALQEASLRLKSIEAQREKASRLESAAAQAIGDGQRAAQRLAELSDLAAQLPARDATSTLLDRAAIGNKGQADAEESLAIAGKELQAARRHLAEAIKATGGPAALERASARIEQQVDLAKRVEDAKVHSAAAATALEKSREELAQAEAAAEAARKDQATSEAAVETASEALASADEKRHAVQHEAAAMTLRGELAPGEPCPVCEQPVPEPPKATRVPALEKVERSLQRAQEVLAEARARSTAATAAQAKAVAQVEAGDKAQQAAEQRLTEAHSAEEALAREHKEVTAELEKAIGRGEPLKVIEAWRADLAEAEALVEQRVSAEAGARERVEQEKAAQGKIESELVQLATTVATLAGQLGGEIRPAVDVAELADGLDLLRKLWEERSVAIQDEQKTALRKQEEAEAGLEAILHELEVDAKVGLVGALKQAGADQARLEERVETLEGRVARFAQLEKSSGEAAKQLKLYTTLADDLLPSRFLKFVLDEERRSLAALGSEHFARMTRDRYRFTNDGNFNVLDLTAAEAERKADTLSGGESFLASLGLALALAEMVTRTGGRLDAFFLDEGFGTLDPEHLELAMEGIEALVSGDRLVVVVSHVPQLRERVEDLIELDKSSSTGDTRVVRP